MNWFRQVLHVGRKDLRFARWYFAGYIAALTLLVVLAFSDGYDVPRGLIMLGMMLLSLTIAILLVQADSAFRVDAFWATQPFSPTAVLTAKVAAMVVGITLPAAAGQAVLLSRLGYGGRELLELVVAGVCAQVLWLVVVTILAALTPNATTFGALIVLGISG